MIFIYKAHLKFYLSLTNMDEINKMNKIKRTEEQQNAGK
jgi:hypothetical protein